jgi:hypothetical protein
MVPVHGRVRRREGLRWFLAGLGIFVYLLLLTWERVELKERSGRIEALESTLQEKRTDQALLQLDLDRKAGYLAVQAAAQEWGMRPAEAHQRFVLAAVEMPATPAQPRSTIGHLAEQLRRSVGGVAQARPSRREVSDAPARR